MSGPEGGTVEEIARDLISTALGCSNADEQRCRYPADQGRFAWGTLGDVIESSPYFPLTINVPDMMWAMYEMFHRVMDYFFGDGKDDESTPRISDFFEALENELPDF